MLKKLDRLCLSEIAQLTLVLVSSVSTLFFLTQLSYYSDILLASQDTATTLLLLFTFAIPGIIKIILPISLFLSTTIVFMRMSSDREMEAWMSCGVSLIRLSRAPLILGMLFTALSLYSALYLEPESRNNLRRYQWMLTTRNVEALLETRLKPHSFIQDLFSMGGSNRMSMYIESMEADSKDFKGVFLAFESKGESLPTQIIVAQSGRIEQTHTPEGLLDYRFRLKNGQFLAPSFSKGGEALLPMSPTPAATNQALVPPTTAPSLPSAVPSLSAQEAQKTTSEMERNLSFPNFEKVNWTSMAFQDLDISLVNVFHKQFEQGSFEENDLRSLTPKEAFKALAEIREKNPDWKKMPRLVRDHTRYYEQWIVPLGCLFLPLIGLCLGLHDPRRKSSGSYVGMLVVVGLYYSSIMLCQQLSGRGIASAEMTLWFPPLVLFAKTVLLMSWRTLHPPSTPLVDFVQGIFKKPKMTTEKSI